MKKTLLFAVLSLTFYGNAQFTQANEPAISDIETMYLCDSFAVNLDGVTGSGVTWDYTTLGGYAGEFRDVEVVAAAATTFAADFPTSVSAIKVGTNLTSYYSSTATERSSQGFVFSEPSLGDVIAQFSANEEIVATYPFAFGNSVNDAFSGDIDYLATLSTTATGNGYASVDGEGTLNLPNGVSLANVLRYKLIDTSWATITLPIPLGNMEFIRTQYEYYDHTVSNLPVFIHSTIKVQNAGAPAPISEQSLVLSMYEPGYLSTSSLDEVEFSVYPNPATETVTISGNLGDNAQAVLFDQSGRELISSSVSNGSTINISALENGVYFVRIQDNGLTTTKSIVKK
jgi:hypothetical protein